MSLDNLSRRLDRMISAVDPHANVTQVLELPTHLLTAGEQERFTAFFATVEPRCFHDSHLDLRDLSNEELATTKLWTCLLKSLDSEDTAAAAKYRTELAA